MAALLVAFVSSLLIALLLVHGARVLSTHLLDHQLDGPQKFHVRAVPRIGGVAIVGGLAIAAGALLLLDREAGLTLAMLMGCGLPAFTVGLLEDLTKRVSPRSRLIATAVSAALAAVFLGAAIHRTDIPGLDWVVSFSAISFLVTVFAVTGVANSINIIDGFNGLASMCSMLMLAALAYVAFQVNDIGLCVVALAGIGAILGFFVWNFPAGLIFLGDGGAYFLGYFVAEVSILLLLRNPEVSPLFPLLVCIYPIVETLFSIYRRRFLRAVPPSMPDGIHLHSLIYRRILRWAIGDSSAKALTKRNSMTSPYLWLLSMLSIMPAVLLWNNASALMLFVLLFVLTYIGLYWRIVRFRSPRWLRALQTRERLLPKADNRRT